MEDIGFGATNLADGSLGANLALVQHGVEYVRRTIGAPERCRDGPVSGSLEEAFHLCSESCLAFRLVTAMCRPERWTGSWRPTVCRRQAACRLPAVSSGPKMAGESAVLMMSRV